MDYYRLGEKIRRHRKAKGMSQEMLAEKAGISVTHMSHIETGNTKLSLSVLVEIAVALGVHTDDLLFDELPDGILLEQELTAVLSGCTLKQVRIITDVAKAVKISMDKYD